MRRRLLGWIAGGIAAGARPTAPARAQESPQAIQGLREVRGDVRVNGAQADAGSLVRPGDTVTTGPGALAAFVIGQDALMMRDSTRAELVGAGVLLAGFRLVTGKLLGVFASGQAKRLETPSATIGIRGTGAYMEVDDERTYFCLCYGSAEIATASGDARDAYSTTHHDSPRYIYGDRREQPIVPALVSNHTDAELIMLEALVGRTPPRDFMDSPVKY
jgi:hypothetical protein